MFVTYPWGNERSERRMKWWKMRGLELEPGIYRMLSKSQQQHATGFVLEINSGMSHKQTWNE